MFLWHMSHIITLKIAENQDSVHFFLSLPPWPISLLLPAIDQIKSDDDLKMNSRRVWFQIPPPLLCQLSDMRRVGGGDNDGDHLHWNYNDDDDDDHHCYRRNSGWQRKQVWLWIRPPLFCLRSYDCHQRICFVLFSVCPVLKILEQLLGRRKKKEAWP